MRVSRGIPPAVVRTPSTISARLPPSRWRAWRLTAHQNGFGARLISLTPASNRALDKSPRSRVERTTDQNRKQRKSPMSDEVKIKALELANHLGGTHAEVVARATAYHAFLSGAAAAKPAAPAAAAKPAAPARSEEHTSE